MLTILKKRAQFIYIYINAIFFLVFASIQSLNFFLQKQSSKDCAWISSDKKKKFFFLGKVQRKRIIWG